MISARGRGASRGGGRGRARITQTPSGGRNTGRRRATPPIPHVSVQTAIPGLSSLSPSPISAARNLSASPSLTVLTRSVNSQQHDDPQPSGVVAALDNLVGSSVAAPPRNAKRWREGGPEPAKLKREKVFRMADSDDESPLRTSAPGFYPTVCQTAATSPEAIEIDTDDDDDVGSLRYPSVTSKKRTWKTKKKSALVINDEVIEISD